MWRLLLATVLVLGMAAGSGAQVLSLKTVDVGYSGGRDGTLGNELQPSDVVGITVVLEFVHSPYSNEPNDHGHWVDGLDLSLDVMSGPGALDIAFEGVQAHPEPGRRGPGDEYIVTAGAVAPDKITIDGYAAFNGWATVEDHILDDLDFLTGFLFHYEGPGQVEVALNLDGPVIHPSVTYPGTGGVNITESHSNRWKYPGFLYAPSWRELEPADLGTLVFNQIPEPFTLGLLALGGLALIRRRLF